MKNPNRHGRADNGQGQGGRGEVSKIGTVPETVLLVETRKPEARGKDEQRWLWGTEPISWKSGLSSLEVKGP